METKIPYKLKISKRAKRIRLTVYCDGSVVLTSPVRAEQSVVENFLTDKKQWLWDKIQFFKNIPAALRRPRRKFSRRDYLNNKEKARALIHERLIFYSNAYDFSFNKVSIKNQKKCWGSCSRKQNLNFNYKIIFLPQKHQDYIIVHELCHLKEFNHSRRFWALVEKIFPDYLNTRRELRNHQMLYKWEWVQIPSTDPKK